MFVVFGRLNIYSQALPIPDHVVIVVLEDHSYNQIIGSVHAPYINSIAQDSCTALFTQSLALTHPSQPNYLHLFSGCNQSVTNNLMPVHPFNTDNLGIQLLDSGYTFYSFHEDLPYPGFDGISNSFYSRNHNPASNWMGTGIFNFPDTLVQPLTYFPFQNFNFLPTLCLVVPNDSNSMDSGNDPDRIVAGDNWLQTNMSGYIQWAKNNNSLFILTFDENDSSNNPITTLFCGEMVKGGLYTDYIDHHTLLRTIEDMYGLRYACDAALEQPITSCWKGAVSVFEHKNKTEQLVSVNPRLFSNYISLSCTKDLNVDKFLIAETSGKRVFEANKFNLFSGEPLIIDLGFLPPAIYVAEFVINNKKQLVKLVKQ